MVACRCRFRTRARETGERRCEGIGNQSALHQAVSERRWRTIQGQRRCSYDGVRLIETVQGVRVG